MIRETWKGKGAALAAALLLSLAAFAHGADRIRVEVGDSPSLGPADAPVTMVEFIDYQ